MTHFSEMYPLSLLLLYYRRNRKINSGILSIFHSGDPQGSSLGVLWGFLWSAGLLRGRWALRWAHRKAFYGAKGRDRTQREAFYGALGVGRWAPAVSASLPQGVPPLQPSRAHLWPLSDPTWAAQVTVWGMCWVPAVKNS